MLLFLFGVVTFFVVVFPSASRFCIYPTVTGSVTPSSATTAEGPVAPSSATTAEGPVTPSSATTAEDPVTPSPPTTAEGATTTEGSG